VVGSVGILTVRKVSSKPFRWERTAG